MAKLAKYTLERNEKTERWDLVNDANDRTVKSFNLKADATAGGALEKALGKEGDVALAISTSGNAANVLQAIDICKKLRIATIGLTGGNGGKMAERVDYLLKVSEGKNTARIQETHILVGHVICEMVDRKLFSA